MFIAVLAGIVITEIVRPKPLNWRPSYTASDTIPYGCFVLFEELRTLFPDNSVERIDETPYSTITERYPEEKTNYLFINTNLDFDEQETNQILRFVKEGNDVFVAATFFGYYLSDTLNIGVSSDYSVQRDTIHLSLTNTSFKNESYTMHGGHYKTHFSSVDTLNTTVLGYLKYSDTDFPNKEDAVPDRVNFIRVKFGKGNFYMNTTPQAFTNYYMLKKNRQYVAGTLSYLDNNALLWDNYKKAGRIIIDSPMRFVLNQPALKWAYYLTIIGLLVFVIFRAKREQRIIPVIRPLPNTSVDFAQTIGGLYYQHGDYTNLISKKLNYFMEYIRSHYYLNITTISSKTSGDLAARSGKSITETKALLDFILYLNNKKTHSEKDIIELNKKIASFKH